MRVLTGHQGRPRGPAQGAVVELREAQPVGGKVIDAAQVRELVNLPSRDVLLARVVGGIGAPISGFVGTLSAMLRGLVNVLDAHRKQLEGSAG